MLEFFQFYIHHCHFSFWLMITIEVGKVICPSRESMRWKAAREEEEEKEERKSSSEQETESIIKTITTNH
jgi:hypothetical protein